MEGLLTTNINILSSTAPVNLIMYGCVCFDDTADAVHVKALLLENSHLLAVSAQRNGICEVLYAAAWICGEFSELVNVFIIIIIIIIILIKAICNAQEPLKKTANALLFDITCLSADGRC